MEWTATDILVLCTPEVRHQILETFFTVEPKSKRDYRKDAQETLSSLLHYRIQTFRSLTPSKQAEHYLRFLSSPSLEPCSAKALVEFHFARRVPLMTAFLDRWCIPHENGQIDADTSAIPTRDQVIASVHTLQDGFEAADVALYFATAGLHMPSWRPSIWGALETLRGEGWLHLDERAETEAPPADEEPETADNFTTLDNLLIKTIVGAVAEIEGAPSKEAVGDLVDEVIRLNESRPRSYFHRGFLYGLLGKESDGEFFEQNAARRAWTFAGQLLAIARRQGSAELLVLVERNAKDLRELMRTPEAIDAAARVAGPLFKAFFAENRDAQAAGLVPAEVLRHAARKELDRGQTALLDQVLQRAGALLRLGRPAEAQRLLELLDAAVTSIRSLLPARFRYHLERRRAQALRATGNFPAAEKAFQHLFEDSPEPDRAQLMAELVLCRGRFKSLWDVRLPADRADIAALLQRLDDVLLHEAIENPGSRINPEYLAGIRAILLERFGDASQTLDSAFAGMSQRLELYADGGLHARTGLYLALSLLKEMREERFDWALEVLRRHGDDIAPAEFPRWLLRDALEVAVQLMTASQARTLVDWSQSRFPEEVDGLLDRLSPGPDLLAKVPALEAALRRRADLPARGTSKRFSDLRCLLAGAQRQQRSDEAASILDAMEALAIQRPELHAELIQLLDDPASYEGAWSVDDVVVCRADLMQAAGHYRNATQLLAASIHRLLTLGSEMQIEQALGFHERIKSWGLPPEETAELDARLARLQQEQQVVEPVPGSGRLRLLFVGGNEMQEKYDRHVTEALAMTHPSVEVEFFHTGWTSNWGEQLEKFKRDMKDRDGAVVMTFIRTELGRQVRKHLSEIGKPWFSCTGHGRDSMVRATLGAVHLTNRHIQRKEPER